MVWQDQMLGLREAWQLRQVVCAARRLRQHKPVHQARLPARQCACRSQGRCQGRTATAHHICCRCACPHAAMEEHTQQPGSPSPASMPAPTRVCHPVLLQAHPAAPDPASPPAPTGMCHPVLLQAHSCQQAHAHVVCMAAARQSEARHTCGVWGTSRARGESAQRHKGPAQRPGA